MLGTGCNIVTTHALFLHVDEEAEDLIRDGEYALVLDEVLDVLAPYNSICEDSRKTVERGDVKYLIDKGSITVGEYGIVKWTDNGQFDDFKFSEIERFAKSGNLICIDGTLFLWQFPPRIFSLFSEVFVLTYLFAGSVLKSYFDFYGIPYRVSSAALVDDAYTLVPYVEDLSIRAKIKPLINICDEDLLNDVGNKQNALSKTWYINAGKNYIDRLRKNINVFIKNRTKADACDVMWTAYKQDYNRLADRGYKYIHKLTAEERKLPEQEKSRLSCFVPCNSRATNDFADRTVLMYLINRYPDPALVKFFAKRNVVLDRDAYALGELLQWIWRSAIRNGTPITIYIPSKRMRCLLSDWLDGQI